MTRRIFDGPGQVDFDTPVAQLDVSLASGRLNVVGTDGPARVAVSAIGRRPVLVELVDGRLSVRYEHPQSLPGLRWWLTCMGRAYRVDVSIAVPHDVVANLRIVSGSLVASGLRHRAEVDVTSGRVSLLGLGGQVHAKTVSGPVEALGIDGDLTVETISGEITVADVVPGRMAIRAISGSITCDLDDLADSQIRLDTTSGEITVRVRADSDLDVRLHAISGRVTSNFPQLPVNAGRGAGHTVTGLLGLGTGRLDASAISGNIALLARPVDDEEPPTGEGAA